MGAPWLAETASSPWDTSHGTVKFYHSTSRLACVGSHFLSSAWRHRKHLSLPALRLPLFLWLMILWHSRLPYSDAWHQHRRRLLFAGEHVFHWWSVLRLCFAILQAIAQWSLSVQVSGTLQQALPLKRPLLSNLRSIIELALPLMKVGFSPLLSSVRSSTKNASKSVYPLFFISLLPHPTAQTLKSPAMAAGLRFLASSTIRSNILSKSSWIMLGGM